MLRAMPELNARVPISLYIGLMSGTSMDSIDAALLEIEPNRMTLRAALARDWPPALQQRLRAAAEHPERIGLDELGRLDVAVGQEFAQAAQQLLKTVALPADAIRAIGSHGQTLLHEPRGADPLRCKSAIRM
jgi:anhydro-N-acetylmuramic acid kinase